jgi:hypothetical protein
MKSEGWLYDRCICKSAGGRRAMLLDAIDWFLYIENRERGLAKHVVERDMERGSSGLILRG